MTYHIKPESGEPGRCSAKPGNCPYGKDAPHFDSAAQARLHYETQQASAIFNDVSKWSEGKLDPELEDYIIDGPFGRFLQHPLIQDMMPDATPALINRRFRHKLAEVELAEEQRDWDRYIFAHERPFRAEKLFELHYSGVELPTSLYTDVWIDSENIWQNMDGWRDVLDDLEAKGERLGDPVDELPETMTVYRGGIEDNVEGFSWTLDKARGEWFAQRFLRPGQTGVLTEATVSKEQVGGYLTGRGESEIIVYPSALDAVLATAKEPQHIKARGER